jgi:hypothetical protein
MEWKLGGILSLEPQCYIVDVKEICHFHLNGVSDITFLLVGDKSEHHSPSTHSLAHPSQLFTLCYNDPTGDFPPSSLAVTVRRPSPTKHQILLPLLLLLLQLREIKFNAWLPTSLAYPNWDPKPSLTHSMDFFFHSAAVSFDRFK